jgi:hypothetical protein
LIYETSDIHRTIDDAVDEIEASII